MPYYRYLIVGGGMTADAAARGIRAVDPEGPIGLISAEPDPPYNRPPLSKGLWRGKPLESIWRHTPDLGHVTVHLGRSAVSLNPTEKQVVDEQGEVYTFERLLLATGGAPNRLPFHDDLVIYFRTLQDYRRLRDLAQERRHFAVIGGGFIGSEMAAALSMNNLQVTMIFPEVGIGARQFPADLATFLNDDYRRRGVEVLAGELVTGLERQGERVAVHTDGGREVTVDAVVVGIGIRPNTELAEAAGLTVENGIVVDERLRTDHPDIFAAGDVATFYNPALGRRLRVEHEDNANTMGELAGRAMAGEAVRYQHLPFFYSDLFDMGYEAVGELNPEYETVADWQERFRKGVIYYLQDGRVRGVLLWNVWGQVEAARALVADPGPFRPADLKGHIRD